MVRARYPLIYLVSHEEQRLDAVVSEVAERHGKQLWEWTITKGLHLSKKTAPTREETRNPVTALQEIGRLEQANLVVVKDFHSYLEDASVVRALRELGHKLKVGLTSVLLVSPTLTIPAELEKEVSVIDVPLPTPAELLQLLKDIFGILKRSGKTEVQLTRDDVEQLVKAGHGLTLTEAENAFAKAIALDNRLDVGDVRVILEEKR